MLGPMDPSDSRVHIIDISDVDEEDDVYEPEDYTGDYPLETDGDEDPDC